MHLKDMRKGLKTGEPDWPRPDVTNDVAIGAGPDGYPSNLESGKKSGREVLLH